MKKTTLLIAILFMSLSYSQVTIGTENDGGLLESLPITSYYGFSYGQSIYLASEINTSGDISSIDFQLKSGADMSEADDMIDVWIGHSSKTSFTSTSDWVDVTSLTKVLNSGTATVAADVLTITFSAPFAYNGTDNLIIAVDANEPGFGGSGDRISVTDGPTSNLSLMYYDDDTNPDPTSPPTGFRYLSRGNITFNGITQACPNPINLTVTNLTPTSADINWDAVNGSTGYNYEYGISPYTQGGGGTTGSSTSNMVSLTSLSQTTTYDFYVQNNCESAYTKVSFTAPAPAPANDECSSAIALTANTDYNCGTVTSGTTAGATASPQPDDAVGTPNNDVWFTFDANGEAQIISLLNIVAVIGTSTDMAMSVFDDTAGCNMVAANEVGESDPNSFTVTGLTAGNTYYVRVYGWSSSTTSTAQATFDICIRTLPPTPSNDDCAQAIALTAGSVFGTNPVDGTVAGATLGAESGSCGDDGPGVWYSVVVPSDGNITIETGADAATQNNGFDSLIEAFSGTCGALTSIECDDDGAEGLFSILNLTGLTAGSTIYIRVWESGGDEDEPFSISAYNSTLSVSSNVIEGFSMFPNPVEDLLKLNAKENIKTISVFNLLGQEVMRTSPNTAKTELSMTHLQTGVYIIKVKIGDQLGTYKILKD